MKDKHNTKALLFDFDGVIHDTFEFHRGKVEEFTGAHMTPEQYREVHTKNYFFRKSSIVENTDWTKYNKYIHADEVTLKIRENIRDALLTFGGAYKLFIVTSASKENISHYLGNNGILQIFSEVLGMEQHRSKVEKFRSIFEKYTLRPKECYFITDTLGDILEANEVDIPTIAVDFGFHDRKTLERGNPQHIVSSFDELGRVILGG